MIILAIQISIGIVLLYLGAEGLVRGSSSLAKRMQISPLVIGLTIFQSCFYHSCGQNSDFKDGRVFFLQDMYYMSYCY
ncbi:MAG: hypothetical protein ACMUIP_08290 [bacterium]